VAFCQWFSAGALPGPPWGNLHRFPRPSSWFKGSYFKGDGEGRETGKGQKTGEKGKGRDRSPFRKILDPPLDRPNVCYNLLMCIRKKSGFFLSEFSHVNQFPKQYCSLVPKAIIIHFHDRFKICHYGIGLRKRVSNNRRIVHFIIINLL